VATGGCFDILHAGHVACLDAARRLGDALVVLVNSDESVRRLKGAGRPAVAAEDRMQVLGALASVDALLSSPRTTRARHSTGCAPTCGSRAATTTRR
jgi:rfaE bifunctional protein nucleotidyltransferase chain/domain